MPLPRPQTADAVSFADPWACIDVCVDGIGPGHDLASAAAIAARRLGVGLRLFQVIAPEERSGPAADPVETQMRWREAVRDLDVLEADACLSDLQVETLTVNSASARTVCDAMPGATADIVAIARYSGAAGDWFAPVARCFLENREQALLVIPDTERPPEDLRRIVVPLDGSYRTERAVHNAIALAEAKGGEIHLVHILAEQSPAAFPTPDATIEDLRLRLAQAQDRRACAYLSGLVEAFATNHVAMEFHVLKGANPGRSILACADRIKADLIVLEGHGAGVQPDVPLGHVTDHVVRHANMPVLVGRRNIAATQIERATTVETVRLPQGADA